jgi:parallel beta-helix repeat protein
MKTFLGLLMLTLGVSAVLVPPASANHISCGDQVTASTTLDNDLSCTGTGIAVAADGITVDLDGHTVRSDTTAVLVRNRDDVTVRGGTVIAQHDGAGVRVSGARNRITEMTAHGGIGIYLESSFYGVVARNTVTDASIGVFLYWSFINEVSQNTLSRISGAPAFGFFRPAGVSVWQSGPTEIAANRFSENTADVRIAGPSARIRDNRGQGSEVGVSIDGYGGIVTGNQFARTDTAILVHHPDSSLPHSHVLIENNVVTKSTHAGIAVLTGEGYEVLANTVTGSRIGIQLETRQSRVADNKTSHNDEDGIRVIPVGFSETRNLLEGNAADHNGDDGISVGRGDNTVRSNVANHNFDLGIEVLETYWGVDGGGNHAKANGNPLQCLNVVCSK